MGDALQKLRIKEDRTRTGDDIPWFTQHDLVFAAQDEDAKCALQLSALQSWANERHITYDYSPSKTPAELKIWPFQIQEEISRDPESRKQFFALIDLEDKTTAHILEENGLLAHAQHLPR